MAFPQHFLDDLRARVPLEDVVARHVKLIRRGREFVGLSPFKQEKSPSFTVVPDKGFYHCFSSGEHGDVIGFVMKLEGLSFPEAVERLAAEAGMEVPRASPAEREAADRRAGLSEVVEAGCVWFEARLRAPEGRAALDYLRGRGLSDEIIARFRLGWAPDSRQALNQALVGKETGNGNHITEDALVECGLLRRPDDGAASFDYFRGRVIFPISDRRGRLIGFGGRVLGDGQPKYLNSPDTPLFNKGRVLYGHDMARKAARDTGRVIVTEGYMDVIALARAGFHEAVAPLGTALTESQIEELWKLADEPILCFDGDEAGRRAAARVAERALPLLKPDKSLRFVTLPAGEDPDSMIMAGGGGAGGARAMAEMLDAARPLDETVWRIETAGRRIDTPERIAGLEKRLEQRALAIADRNVQYQYQQSFRARMRARAAAGNQRNGANGPYGSFRGRNGRGYGGRNGSPAGRGGRGGRGIGGIGAFGGGLGGEATLVNQTSPDLLHKRQEQVLIAVAVNHPALLEAYGERFGMINLSDPMLDRIRQDILMAVTSAEGLDSEGIKRHLMNLGHADSLDALLGPDVYVHAGFARPGTAGETVRLGFDETLAFLSRADRLAELREAERGFVENPTDENWARFEKLKTDSQTDQPGRDPWDSEMGDSEMGDAESVESADVVTDTGAGNAADGVTNNASDNQISSTTRKAGKSGP